MGNGEAVRPTWGAREYTIATISILGGALLGFGILQLLGGGKSAPGDEPPITVKHGSIDLNLVSTKNHQKWDKQNNKAYWEIKDKTAGGSDYSHNQDHYDVLVGYTFATDGTPNVGCKGATYASAKKVAFTYHQKDPGTGTVTATFEISAGGTTMMTPSTGFTLDESGRTLRYGKTTGGTDDEGYISEIVVDGVIWCTFDGNHQPSEIALLDAN